MVYLAHRVQLPGETAARFVTSPIVVSVLESRRDLVDVLRLEVSCALHRVRWIAVESMLHAR